jgi:hypothetical protein
MQAATESQTPAPASAPPAPPVPQAPTITITGSDGKTQILEIPQSSAEIRELLAQRRELASQLDNVSSRRSGLAQEIRNTSDAATRTGLEERLRVLDSRILQLETDLATVGRRISSAPSELVQTGENAPSGGDQFDEGFAAGGFSIFGAMAILLVYLRRKWKRAPKAKPVDLGGESSQRLERLEQGMESIAIEIERVSEGQRFVTRLLSEGHAGSNSPQRIAQPVAIPREDPATR